MHASDPAWGNEDCDSAFPLPYAPPRARPGRRPSHAPQAHRNPAGRSPRVRQVRAAPHGGSMDFGGDRPLADPAVAARKLLELNDRS
jgi:hypothetical protein